MLTLAGCTDPSSAIQALERVGFTNIQATGYRLGCGKGEYISTGFAAKSPKGDPVTGVVCRNIYKLSSIKLD